MLHTKAIKYCTHTLFISYFVLLYMWVLRNSRKSVRRSARVVCTAHALWAVWTWRDRQRSSDLNAIWRRAPAPPGHRPDHTHSPITINLFLWLHCQFRHVMVVFTVHSSFGTVGNHTDYRKHRIAVRRETAFARFIQLFPVQWELSRVLEDTSHRVFEYIPDVVIIYGNILN